MSLTEQKLKQHILMTMGMLARTLVLADDVTNEHLKDEAEDFNIRSTMQSVAFQSKVALCEYNGVLESLEDIEIIIDEADEEV